MSRFTIIFKYEFFNVSTFLALAYNGLGLAEGQGIELRMFKISTNAK